MGAFEFKHILSTLIAMAHTIYVFLFSLREDKLLNIVSKIINKILRLGEGLVENGYIGLTLSPLDPVKFECCFL